MFLIPTDTGLLFWQQITTLDGTDYLLEFRFNSREQVYYLMVSLTDGTLLAQGIKLVCSYPLLQAYNDDRFPLGELIVLPDATSDGPPGLGELGIGQRCQLVYVTAAEIQAAGWDPWRNPNPPPLVTP